LQDQALVLGPATSRCRRTHQLEIVVVFVCTEQYPNGNEIQYLTFSTHRENLNLLKTAEKFHKMITFTGRENWGKLK
jgi:hypothetical protein